MNRSFSTNQTFRPGSVVARSEQQADAEGSQMSASVSAEGGFDLTQVPCQEAAARDDEDGGAQEEPASEAAPEQGVVGEATSEQQEGEEPGGGQSEATTETGPSPAAESPEASPEATADATTTAAASAGGLIAEDSVTELKTGQMRKTDFLQQLRESICNAIDPVLAGAGRSSEGCPYLNYWLNLYEGKDAAHIEQAARKYAPDTANARSAGEYISIIAERAVSAAETWVATGRLSGVPEGVPTTIPGQPAPADAGEGNVMQAKARDGGAKETDDPRMLQQELGEGQPLTANVRDRMETAFGMNFSHVRTHTDTRAMDLSHRVNARAFTVGNHIAFGNGEYQPGTVLGDALIAHELAHTVQQNNAKEDVDKMEVGSAGYDALERDADQAAAGAVSSLWNGKKEGKRNILRDALPLLRSGLKLQRCDEKPKEKAPVPGPSAPPPSASAPSATIAPVTFNSTANRVAPNKTADVAVTLSGLASGTSATLDIDGSGGTNGTASITAGASLSASGTVTVKGGTQTTPGNAGKLSVRAKVGGVEIGRSPGFTVAAYPINYTDVYDSDINDGTVLGMVVQDGWSSDGGGPISELNEVAITERVDNKSRDNPPFTIAGASSATSGTSGYNAADTLTKDTFQMAKAGIVTTGLGFGEWTRVQGQICLFKDNRTGVTDQIVPSSGFKIIQKVYNVAATPGFKHKTRHEPATITVEGHAATPGGGTAESPEHVL